MIITIGLVLVGFTSMKVAMKIHLMPGYKPRETYYDLLPSASCVRRLSKSSLSQVYGLQHTNVWLLGRDYLTSNNKVIGTTRLFPVLT